MPKSLMVAVLFTVAPAMLSAQQADTTNYVILRGADTVATERVVRGGVTRSGELTVRAMGNRLTVWSVVLAPDGAAAMVEATETEPPEDPRMKARVLHRTRIIFKEDSVAVDDMTSKGMMTDIYPTMVGAMPYLNLSVGTLEAAAQQGLADGEVPLFNMGGGQTVVATVTRTGDASATLQIGPVSYAITFDKAGRLVEAAVPSQQLRMARR